MTCELKGQGFRGLLEMLRKQHGEETLQRVTALLTNGDFRELVRGQGLMATGWYPLSWYAQLHEAIAQVQPGTARTLGKAAAREDVNTVFRFVLSLASPARLASLGSRIFATFLRGAVVSVQPQGEKLVVITFANCAGASEDVWLDFEGSIEAFVELSGAKGCQVRHTTPSDSSGVFQVTWD